MQLYEIDMPEYVNLWYLLCESGVIFDLISWLLSDESKSFS